jgi:hypothetical protein
MAAVRPEKGRHRAPREWTSLVRALRLLRHPIPPEKQRLMDARWAALDPRWRTPGQGLGRQATGCGATIGIHPGCDFACTGCYLGMGANQARRSPQDETFRQLDRLRVWLGPKGNAQITDGEVTLLPAEELIEILRYSRRIGLIPMLMTHGDGFRRRPGLLERLMIDGGLTELSIHVDTTQRGRLGYRNPRDERALEPLRDEFAAMVRAARRRTGLPLRAAMTLTITGDNLGAVAHVVEWCFRNRDVFGLLSFQPVAQVGRTCEGLPSVTVGALWDQIQSALTPYGSTRRSPGVLTFGHPDCTRLELFVAYEHAGSRPRVLEIVRTGSREDEEVLDAFFARGLGGVNFRDDRALERVCRATGILLSDPRWMFGPLRRWLLGRLADLGTSVPRLAWDALRDTVRVSSFAVVSHHFMSPAELAAPTGKDRLAACLFRVPIGEDLVPMCRVNAGGVRETFYARHGRSSGAACDG